MKFNLLAIIWSATLFGSCKKESSKTEHVIKNGTYTGIFQRQASGTGMISNVTITFSDDKWSGESQYIKYPALCNGKYTMNNNHQIRFENTCAWTAEFDGTLILSGNYQITVVGSYLEIARDYNGAFKDIYKLSRQ